MSYFNEAFTHTIGFEGGYVNDPEDPGKQTKFGISKKSHPQVDIERLTLDGAKVIYKEQYWNPMFLDSILSRSLACKIFDICVNIGIQRTLIILSNAISFSRNKIPQDSAYASRFSAEGVIESMKSVDEQKLIRALCGEQYSYYKWVISRNPTLVKFYNGWIKRAMWPLEVS
jgi:lysozyme family protein